MNKKVTLYISFFLMVVALAFMTKKIISFVHWSNEHRLQQKIFSSIKQIYREPTGQYVIVGGHRLWYRIAGKGEPLLLIPGGPGLPHNYLWPSFEQFSDSFQVIYFDAFGRGFSDHAQNPRDYSFSHDVTEIEGLRLALGLGKINVYGHSYGGIVAQEYALRYPQSVQRLILANTIHSAEMWQKGVIDNWNHEVLNQYPEVWARLDSLRSRGFHSGDSAYDAIEDEVPSCLLYFCDPSNVPSASNGFSQANWQVFSQIVGPNAATVLGGDMASMDFRSRLASIRVPTLILAGRFDRVSIPRYSTQYRTFMPQAQFVMFEASGHAPFLEEPERHSTIVRQFLKR
jgi:proline iminopeptidase